MRGLVALSFSLAGALGRLPRRGRTPAQGGESRAGAAAARRPRLLLPWWGWLAMVLVTGCLVALGWFTVQTERLVTRSISLQNDQVAAWEVGNLQRQLLRLEVGVSTANARRAVSREQVLRDALEQAVAASAVLEGGSGSGLTQLQDWQPLLRRVRQLLGRITKDFEPFLKDPGGVGPGLLIGLREVGRLTEQLATRAYEANIAQAQATMSALRSSQRYLAGIQAGLVVLLLLLVGAVTFTLRARLRAAYEQIETQRKVEAELRQAKDAAEEASRVKSDFLASMSHELRTPLTAMLGFCQLVMRDTYGRVPKRIREALAKVQDQGDLLLHLVSDVLDLSRIEANRMELHQEAVPPAQCIQGAVERLSVLAEEKGLALEIESDVLPASWYCDAQRISQVLINLIGNAIKFTEQGSVRIGGAARNGELHFHVSDTGIGIAPDRIDVLFTEFQQVDSTIAREAPGAGLGLAISKRIVELHGGRMWVDSQPGVGSTFWFSLPERGGAHGEG